jgi:hypothetical protein
VPPVVNIFTRYFLTIEVGSTNEQYLSIFLSINYRNDQSPADLWNNMKELHPTECSLVQFVVHSCLPRSNSSNMASELSGLSLEVQSEVDDFVGEPNGSPGFANKIGGRPYFYLDSPKYISAVEDSLLEGYTYFLQISCPHSKNSPNGDWPFSDYTLHVLAKETPKGIIWRYGWG